MATIIYKGFTTHNYVENNGTLSLTNIELVNMDILSHIYTEQGERVMMPLFGTSIPTMPFEPLTNDLMEKLRDDLERVFEYEPRVEKLQLLITPYFDQNSVVASATLRYHEFGVVDSLDFVINLGDSVN